MKDVSQSIISARKEAVAIQTIPLKPKRWQISVKMAALAACVLGMLCFPALCVPFALATPLFACPLLGLKEQWAAFSAVAAPAVISLAVGMDALYSISLLLVCGLPLTATWLLRSSGHTTSTSAFLFHISAYTAALLCVVIFATRMLGGNLTEGLTTAVMQPLVASPNVGITLYRLAAAGLIGVPKAYQSAAPLVFALNPTLIHQLLLSLRLTLTLSFSQLLPSLFVQCCLIGGLFTALRVQRFHHAYLVVDAPGKPRDDVKRVHVAIPAGFSLIQLPPACRWPLLMLGLASLFFSGSDNAMLNELSLLMYTTFVCVYQLLGAAVMVCLLSARNHDHIKLYGVLTAALYLMVPFVLFLMGILDSVLHFRSKTLFQQEEE